MPTLTDPDLDKNNRSAEASKELFDLEKNYRRPAIDDDQHNTRKKDSLEDNYNQPAIADADRNTAGIREREQTPSFIDKTTVGGGKAKGKGLGRFSRKKKTLIGVGIGGGAGIVIAIIMMLLPLKLEMFVQNITKHAMAVPGYAVEQRTEYLVTRAIAARMLSMAYGDTEGSLVFCKGGGIACSLYKTYTTKFIENKFDLKMTKDGHKITIEPRGREGLGGDAHRWKISVDMTGVNSGNIETRLISKNSEMRAFLKDHVKTKIPDRSVNGSIKRFIARKVLMRKYGVTMWRGLEKTKANITELKTSVRASIIKNVYGRLSSRLAIAMGCISSPDLCAKTIDKIQPDNEALAKLIGNTDLASAAEKATGEDIAKVVMEAVSKTSTAAMAKIGTKAIPILGQVWLIDSIIKAVDAVNSGAVDKVVNNIVSSTYIAYAYGDGAGIVTNSEKLKAGDLDMDTLGVLSGMFDGAEASPLMATENGISNASMASLFGGTAYAAGENDSQITCSGSFGTKTTIQSGQLICDNQKINRQVTTALHDTPGLAQVMDVIGGISGVWKATIGQVFTVLDNVLGGITSFAIDMIPQGIKDALSQLVAGPMQDTMKWLMDVLFMPPNVGMDASGVDNYVGLSGGIRVESNELMENGVDESGNPLGGGGQYLSPQQVADIYSAQDAVQPKPSYLASLFSPSVEGSLTQQFALLAPSSGIGLVGSLLNIPATLMSGFNTKSFAASKVSSTVVNNPFNQVLYGYSVGDPALSADPNNYTPETCKKLADDRADLNNMQQVSGVAYKVITKTDPCALEKTVVGALLADAGVTDDQYSLKDPMQPDAAQTPASNGNTSNTGQPANTTSRGGNGGWTLTNGVDYSATPCDPRTTDAGVFTSPTYKWKIRLCHISLNTPASKPGDNGSKTVNSLISTNAMNMLEAAKAAGINIGLSDGMRKSFSGSYFSMHTTGLAMDLGTPGGTTICYAIYPWWMGPVKGYGSRANAQKACESIKDQKPIQYKAYQWLLAHAGEYGFHNFGQEPWHYSTSGNGT